MTQATMRKANNKRRRTLGTGAYEREINGEEKPSKKDAQGYFLEVVRHLVPEVLEDLSGEPSRLYRQIPEVCFKADKERLEKFERLNLYDQIRERYTWENYQRPSWGNIEIPFVNPLLDPTLDEDDERVLNARLSQQLRGKIFDPTPADKAGRIAAFRKCLFEWSRNHNLDEMWCRERAYNTLEEWSDHPEWHKQPYWAFQINFPHSFIAGGEPRFVFDRRTQYPLHNTHKFELESAVAEFTRQYDAFLTKFDENAEASGLEPAPIKPPDHVFEILVRYHMQEWKHSEIAKEYLLSEKRVSHLIPDTARLIGLRLTNRRGRPRKS